MTVLGDPPDEVVARVRPLCLALPESHEQKAWVGARWRIRTRTFAHVLEADGVPVLTFRSDGEELEVLRHTGHPFFHLGWGRNAVGMVLDDRTDWAEVRELLVESYCLLAPKKLAAQLDRPPP